MKTIIKLILIVTLCTFVFTDCKKYADGPIFSLRTRKARLEGDWKISKMTLNGVDLTFNTDYIIHIKKGGTYSISAGSYSDDGKWSMGEDGDDVTFTSNDPNLISQTYRILRLKNKELWWKRTMPNGDVEETHMIQ